MRYFLFSLLLVIPLLSSAQSNFQPGYIVTNTKDTLKGYVDYRERSNNITSFNFKSVNGSIQKYTVANCRAYGVDHTDAFERYEVSVSQSSVNPAELSSGPDLMEIEDTVFLRVIQKGVNLNLFSYTDRIKERFYIMERDKSTPEELIRQIYLKPGQSTMVVTDDKYVRQLLMIMRKLKNGVSEEEKKLVGLNYKSYELKKLVASLNGQVVEKSKYKKVRFFAGAGLSVNQTKYKGDNDFASPSARSKTSYTPFITVGADVFVNPAIRRLIFRTELSYLRSKNEIAVDLPASQSNSVHSFDESSIVITPQIIYNIYNSDHIKFFLGIGGGFNFSAYKNNVTVINVNYGNISTHYEREDYTELEKFHFALPFTAGITLNKKIEIVAGYQARSVITQYAYYSVGIQRYKIGVNYLFGKH